MNTYEQDETIPIYIILQYGYYTLKFPINPDNLTKDIPSESETVNIEGLGEVSIPTKPKLAKISINSFFWHQNNLVPASQYVTWLEKWQASKKPANLIVTRLNYSMQVTCENFKHWINAGEEKDVYFELQLQEYRPYGARKLNNVKNKTILQKLKDVKELLTSPILVEIPRPTRSSTLKAEITNPYTTKPNETLITITKSITGTSDEWKLLYDENKKKIGDLIENSNEIPEGTKLTLPNKWVEDSSYNIRNLAGV